MSQTAPERPAAIPVLHNGRLAGLLTPDNIGELYMINAALRARGGRPRFAPPVITHPSSAKDLPPLTRPTASSLHE